MGRGEHGSWVGFEGGRGEKKNIAAEEISSTKWGGPPPLADS